MNEITKMSLDELKIAFYDLSREKDICDQRSIVLNQVRNMVAQRINEIIEKPVNSSAVESLGVDLDDEDKKITA